MRIHEVTKAPQQVDEGLLDTVKNALTPANMFSPKNFATAQQKSNQATADRWIEKTNVERAAQGLDPLAPLTRGKSLDQVITQYKQDPDTQTAIKKLEPEFEQDFVMPEAGKVLQVTNPKNNSIYYKADNGRWYNQDGGTISAVDATGLEQLANDPRNTDEVIPPPVIADKIQVNEAAPKYTAGAEARRQLQRKATPAVEPTASVANPEQNLQQNFQAWAEEKIPGLAGAYKNPEVKNKLDTAFKALVLSQKNPEQAKKEFVNYMTIAKASSVYVQQTQQGATTTIRGNRRRKVIPRSQQGQALAQELNTDGADGLASLKGQQVRPTGNPALDDLLRSSGVLAESQTFISKDIHVKTPKGDYVKKASDQQWYDPNGVLIDPIKYAEYIKKLDATTSAQTRYQADAIKGKGSDTAYEKRRIAKANARKSTAIPAPAAPAEDPAAAMLRLQDLQNKMRNANVSQLNQQIKDTTQQLRMADIFGTGQSDYLRQQLAMLIALKA